MGMTWYDLLVEIRELPAAHQDKPVLWVEGDGQDRPSTRLEFGTVSRDVWRGISIGNEQLLRRGDACLRRAKTADAGLSWEGLASWISALTANRRQGLAVYVKRARELEVTSVDLEEADEDIYTGEGPARGVAVAKGEPYLRPVRTP